MSRPSISVRKLGYEFSFASTLRQSYSVAQYCASACRKASCTPCDASVTVSRSGHLVALMRLRNSVSSASGTSTQNERRAVSSAACSLRGGVAMAWGMVCLPHEMSWLSESPEADCLRISVPASTWKRVEADLVPIVAAQQGQTCGGLVSRRPEDEGSVRTRLPVVR